MCRRLLERRRNRFVRLVGRLPEVTGAHVLRRCDLRQPQMDGTDGFAIEGVERRLGEERVSESDRAAGDLDDAVGDSRSQRGLGVGHARVGEEPQRRLGRGRGVRERVTRLGRKRGDALARQRRERRRNRERAAGIE